MEELVKAILLRKAKLESKTGNIRAALLSIYQGKGKAEKDRDEAESKIVTADKMIAGLENQLSVLEPMLQEGENASTIEDTPDGGSDEE